MTCEQALAEGAGDEAQRYRDEQQRQRRRTAFDELLIAKQRDQRSCQHSANDGDGNPEEVHHLDASPHEVREGGGDPV